MGERSEAELRDHLATHLDLVESGLQFLEKEYALPNAVGAAGRIDILARDRFGALVVIELKRSNASARSALHEIMKYVALLKSEKGISAAKLRCVVVSTEWRELLVPFSELVHSSPFSVEGRVLRLGSDGLPSSTEQIKPISICSGLSFPDDFPWLTFATPEAQSRVFAVLSDLLPKVGVKNVVLFKMRSNDRDRIPYPYSIILLLFQFDFDEARAVLQQGVFPFQMLDDFREMEADDADFPEAVKSSFCSEIFLLDGIGEVSCPARETLAAERDWWELQEVFRYGPLVSDRLVASDNDLLLNLAGIDGANDVTMIRAVDPKHKAQFSEFSEVLSRLLLRYGWWEPVAARLDKAHSGADCTIVACAHCPTNLLARFALFLRTHDHRWLPSFDLLIACTDDVQRMGGFVAWDGVTEPSSAVDTVREFAPAFFFASLDDGLQVMSALGLVFATAEVINGRPTVTRPGLRSLKQWQVKYEREVSALSKMLPAVPLI